MSNARPQTPAIQRRIHHRAWIRTYEGKRGTTHAVCHSADRKRRVARRFHDLITARKYRRDFERFLNGKGPDPEETERYDGGPLLDWGGAVETFLASGNRKPSTLVTYRSLLELFRAHAGVRAVEQVTGTMLEAWLNAAKRGDRDTPRNSPATLSAKLRAIAAFMRWAKPGDACPVTPEMIHRWAPYRHVKRSRPHLFTPEQLEDILSACKQITPRRRQQRDCLWWQAYISVLYYTGFRLQEVSHLIWADVDWERSEIRVRPHRRLRGVFDWSPKGKQHRSVPVPDSVISLLTQLQVRQTGGIPYVFLEADRYQSLKARGGTSTLLHMIRSQFVGLCRKAGIENACVHDMRRSFVTRLLKNGLEPRTVQILAGHQDLSTTLAVYAEVTERDAVDAARKLLRKKPARKRGRRSKGSQR